MQSTLIDSPGIDQTIQNDNLNTPERYRKDTCSQNDYLIDYDSNVVENLNSPLKNLNVIDNVSYFDHNNRKIIVYSNFHLYM